MIIAYAYKKYKQKKQEKEEKKRAAAAGGSAQPTQDGEPQPRSSSEARQENQQRWYPTLLVVDLPMLNAILLPATFVTRYLYNACMVLLVTFYETCGACTPLVQR
ncbi:hypothetical protein J3A83DRAFT_4187625 [Scleroderma citrinum]